MMKNSTFQDVIKYLSMQMSPDQILNDLPLLEKIPKGLSYFVVNANAVVNLNDVTFDGLNPWSGKDAFGKRTTTKITNYDVEWKDEKYVQSSSGGLVLRIVRNIHPHHETLRREIFYVVDGNNNLLSNVFYVYQTEVEVNAEKYNVQSLLPSERLVIKEALFHRTTLDAQKYLRDKGIAVETSKLSSISRSVPEHVKTNICRKAPMDFHSVYDRYVLKPNREELIDTPLIICNENDLRVRIMVGFPDAIKCFGASLPTLEDLMMHRQVVDLLQRLNVNEQEERFRSYLSSVTVSGSLPVLGSCLLIDTTFSLTSSEYITLALGVSDTFKNKSSMKNSSILLGYMIHSSKDMEEHECFSKFLNSMFSEHCIGKTLGLIIHDGEKSFSAYNNGSFLQNAILIRCDVHRLQNIKDCIKKDGIHEYESVKTKLYGWKQTTDHGIVVKRGILNYLDRDKYDYHMFAFIDEAEGELKRWLISNMNSLWDNNSMFMKLKAAWPSQFLTSNIIESKNSYLKQIISCKKPAQKILNDFLRIHRGEIEERIKAVGGYSETIKTEFGLNPAEWALKSHLQKRLVLTSYGLQTALPPALFEHVPIWARPAKVTEEILNDVVQDLVIHTSSSNSSLFFLLSKKNMKDLAVTLTLPDEMKREIINQLERKKNERTITTELRTRMRPEQGTKYIKRKGKQYSRSNHTRNFVNLIDTTTSSIEASFLNDSDLLS